MSIPPLGDHFTLKYRKEFAKRNLQPGSIINCYVTSIKNPKEKRILVLNIDNQTLNVGFVIFNTDKPKSIYIRKYQLHFNAAGRDYLDHNCYFDCSQIHEISKVKLLDILTHNPEKHKGFFDIKDFDLAKSNVANAHTISPKLIKRYGLISYKQQP